MNFTIKDIEQAIPKLRFKFPYTASEWMEHKYLENYHCHKDFSNICVPDCTEFIENYAERIKELGSGQCLYSGEHGSQGDQFHVYKIAEQYGLKYRHSAEAYMVKDRHEKDRTNAHVIIVAKNPEGRKDLNYILSIANEDGYYYQPRIDLELLLSVNPNNFIVTSACIGGLWKYEDADELILKIAAHFKDNFFLEIQCHNTERQKELNRHILDLAQKYAIQIICGLDSHYVLPENAVKREIIQKDKGISYNDDEAGWVMDYPDTNTVIERLEKQGVLTKEQILESILNTNVFVDECKEIVFDRKFKIPNIYKDLDYEGRVQLLKNKINEKYKADPNKSKEKILGLRWEAEQFVDSGTVDYPLLSEAIVKTAVEDFGGTITTTARGSAGAFMINNYMGLTTIDRFNSDVPIYQERFLTKERVLSGQCPDVDSNITDQEPFVKATRSLLGEHGCYPLMTRSTYKVKSAWLMYARVNGVEAEKSFALSKALDLYDEKMKYADEEEREFIKVDDYIPQDLKQLYEESIPYQGITIAGGIHACAVLCFDGDIRREIGLISAKSETTGKRTLVAAVEGKYLDEFGYVKEDFLIVDSVSLTEKLFRSIGQEVPSFEELKKMVDGDEKTWEIYAKGITCCVNQCEKEGAVKKLNRYKPKNIAELCAFIAAIRPGFASLVNNFINRKEYSTGEPRIDELLKDSAHYMLYQESIMKVLSFLGLPMTETYGIIKAISKKKLKGEKKDNLLKELKENWLKEFGNLDNFSKVWKVIEDAAAYSFNSCVSGELRLDRNAVEKETRPTPTIKEMYYIKNDKEYAKKNNQMPLYYKYNKEGYGKCLSLEDDKIAFNRIVDIYAKGIKPIYRVVTESGHYIDCTMDHKFPLPNGEEKKLQDLKIGDKLICKGRRNLKYHYFSKVYSKIVAIYYLKDDEVFDIEMEDPYHTFVPMTGIVACNCHSYAMAGDSLYLAWFKAHYPYKFYETAITHYQEKKTVNKKKMDDLLKEALKFYGFKYGDYKFGQDNRRINITDGVIIPNLSIIKGFGNKIAGELYSLSSREIHTFIQMLDALKSISINSKQIQNLIDIGYFTDFGSTKKLSRIKEIYEKLGKAKCPSFTKFTDLDLNLEKAKEFGEQSKTKINKFRAYEYLNYIESTLQDEPDSPEELMRNKFRVLGTCSYVDSEYPNNKFFILTIKSTSKISRLTIYSPKCGKSKEVKIWNSQFEREPISEGDFIVINSFDKKPLREPSGELDQNGKKIYAVVPNKFEYFIKSFRKEDL